MHTSLASGYCGKSPRGGKTIDEVARARISIALPFWTDHTAMMRQYATDYRIWAIVTGLVFIIILMVYLLTENIPLKQNSSRVVMDLMLLAAVSGIIGWVVQASAVVLGFRIVVRPDRQQEADYDDWPHSKN
jgi:hypothetical protein